MRISQVTNSVGHGVIYDPAAFDWQGDDFQVSSHNELVIYELHIGSFHVEEEGRPGGFETMLQRLDHLVKLGVNAIQIMPIAEFAGDYSWGYNPAHIFAVESAYGGPDGFKQLVREAHKRGIAVILDVVYNHFGTCGSSMAGRRTTRAASTSTTIIARRRPGGTPARTTAVARFVSSSTTT